MSAPVANVDVIAKRKRRIAADDSVIPNVGN